MSTWQEDQLQAMEINGSTIQHGQWEVTRVPTGWVYFRESFVAIYREDGTTIQTQLSIPTSVFVPYILGLEITSD